MPVRVVNVDKLTYAGNPKNLRAVESNQNYRFIYEDIVNAEGVESAFVFAEEYFGRKVDAVVHFAAESHVDRSIDSPVEFLQTNVVGTQVMLETARRHDVHRFVHISTDEVYGSLGIEGSFTEESSLSPNNPYAASKAAADMLAHAYHQTYNFPVIITRSSNNYGPSQFPEKLIPLMIANALNDQPLPVYGDGMNVRDWLHVRDHCRAIVRVLEDGKPGEIYNISGRTEKTNLDIVKTILRQLEKSDSLIQFVADRPGHDRRYSMDTAKIEENLRWQPEISFENGIRQTIDWYLNNSEWVKTIKTDEYRDYYNRMYKERQSWIESLKNERD